LINVARYMKKEIVILVSTLVILFVADALFALDAGKIIAYPVPFNPRRGERTLKIGIGQPEPSASSFRLKVEIFDVNGDLVFKRTYYNALPAIWNGHNRKGNLVKPGLYIMKIDLENTATDDHSQGKKIIRILINY